MSQPDKKRRRKWDVVDPNAVKSAASELASKSTESFTCEIDINSCPAATRFSLTKVSTFDQIQKDTGAVVITRGSYVPPAEMNLSTSRPLHLHITAKSKEALAEAEKKIKDMIKVSKESAVLGGLLSSQVFVKFEQPIESEFNVTGKLLGPKGQFLRQVAVDSGGAKVHLRGKDTLPGADDPLHIYISANSQGVLDKAIKLATDLVTSVHKQYEEFKIKKATLVPYPPYSYPYPPYMPYGYPPARGPYRPPYGYYPPPARTPALPTGPPGATPEYSTAPAMPYPPYPYAHYTPTTETTTPSATSASDDPSAAYSQYYAQYQTDPNYDYSAYYGAYSETSAQPATETTTETTNTQSTTPTSNHKRSYQDYVNGDSASNGTKSLNNG